MHEQRMSSISGTEEKAMTTTREPSAIAVDAEDPASLADFFCATG
jgi:hypothetical protein